MIDVDGYRANVAIVLLNHADKVLWCRRVDQDLWQFPQGGIQEGEKIEESMYRELYEETGLVSHCVDILACTRDWLYYDFPPSLVSQRSGRAYIGQKQIWYLLRFHGADSDINLSVQVPPEFDDWRWVDYHYPLDHIVEFKRTVYQKALSELHFHLSESPC